MASLVLGILSIVLGGVGFILVWWFGLAALVLGIVAVILGIIGIVAYRNRIYGNGKAGFVTSIVGTSLGGADALIYLIAFIAVMAMAH